MVTLMDQTLARRSGGLVIVTGEPGIGKSTVLRHGRDLASARGFITSVGRCHDGSSDSTLFPWIAAWRPLIEQLSDAELEQIAGQRARWLAQILPEIGERLGVEPSTSTDLFSLFDAIVRTLRKGAQLEPICIVLEDLHWADENSIRLLAVMAEELVDSPVVILASWRDTEVVSPDVGAPLEGLLAKSLRLVQLGGLDPDAISELVARLADDASLDVAQLAARTGGNPLFINELLHSQQLIGQLAPSDTVRAAINSRLRLLPEGTAASLAVGALCPNGFSEQLLADVLDLDPDEVLDQLEAALAARMIEEDPDHVSGFRFSHDLFAETLVDGVSAARQKRLHTSIGVSLERSGATVGALAHHFLHGAGDEAAVKGAEYAHRAAVASLRLFDYDGALRLIEAGLAALDGHDDDALLADLLLELITVKKHTAQPPAVHEVAYRAFEAARRAGNPHRMARVTVAFEGSTGPMADDNDPTWLGYWCPPGVIIPMIEECLEKLPADDSLIPLLWTCLGFQYFGEFDDTEAVDRAFAAAVEAARRERNPAKISFTLHQRHSALQRVLGFDERRALLDEAILLADGKRHPLQTVAAHRARAVLELDGRNLQAATAVAQGGGSGTDVDRAASDRRTGSARWRCCCCRGISMRSRNESARRSFGSNGSVT
ncbi:MAG: AAA family ATPase [Acidimicrobiales bacterium]